MPQAQITINAVVGSNDDLTLDAIVQLDNNNIGGEVSFLWEILDQPTGPADILSNATIQNPTFTPKKEGTYLIRLTVNEGLPDEDIDSAIAAIRQLKTRERVPAAGETLEDNASRGWAEDANVFLRTVDTHIADPGTLVGVNATAGTLARGTVIRATSSETIKTGLPGEEDVPGFTTAPATDGANLDELLLVVEGGVDGSDPVSAGALLIARFIGRLSGITLGGGAVGDVVFVSDTATLALTPGTSARQVGSISSIDGADRDIWFAGTQAGNAAPADLAYVIYGNPGALFNAIRVDGLNAGGVINNTPFTVRAGDLTTIPLIAKKFSLGATANLFRIEDQGGSAFVLWDDLGNMVSVATAQALNLIATNGAQIGFVGTPTADTLDVGDALFRAIHPTPSATSVPRIDFDGFDNRIAFDRSAERFDFIVNTNTAQSVYDWGVEIFNAMRLGFSTGLDPGANIFAIGDADFRLEHATPGAASVPTIVFDSGGNNFRFTRAGSNGVFRWDIDAAQRMSLNNLGVGIEGGLTVGAFLVPVADTIKIGDDTFLIDHSLSGSPAVSFDAGDNIRFIRASNIMAATLGGTTVWQIEPEATLPDIFRVPQGRFVLGPIVGGPAVTGEFTINTTNGDQLVYEDSDGDQRRVQTEFFPSVVDTTVANTTTETLLKSQTFAADKLGQFSIVKVRAWGFGGATASPLLNITLRWGAVVTGVVLVNFSETISTPQASSFEWIMDIHIIVRANGAAAPVRISTLGGINGSPTTENLPLGAPETQRVDTAIIDVTAATDLTLSAQWGTASSQNTITISGFIVEFT